MTVLFAFSGLVGYLNVTGETISQGNAAEFEDLMRSVNMTSIRETMRFLSTNYPSRFIGTEGYYQATEYISNLFNKYGLDVTLMEYETTAPVSQGANITILSGLDKGLVIPLFPFMPNNIHPCMTPPGGLKGHLVYAGEGGLGNVKGKELEGSMALMDFNSGDRWLTYANFGAKAVIFLEPEFTTEEQVAKKRVNVPLNFPRFMAKKEDASRLLSLAQAGTEVRLVSDMRYKNVQAYNILGYLPGTDPNLKDQVIIVSASYDSYSIAPDLAPGADYSSSISVLLELVKHFTQNRPRHPILFTAFSGLTLDEIGARTFTSKLLYGDFYNTLGANTAFMIDLQLTSNGIDVVYTLSGYFYYLAGPSSYNHNWFNEKILRLSEPDIQQAWTSIYGKVPLKATPITWIDSILGGGYYPDGWWGHIPGRFQINSEPWIDVTGSGATLKTADVLTPLWGTPADTMDKIDETGFNNLKHQYEYILSVLSHLLNRDRYELAYTIRGAKEQGWIARHNRGPALSAMWKRDTGVGFTHLIGQVVEYNYTTTKYVPVPNAMIYIRHDPPYLEFGAYGPMFYNYRIEQEFTVLSDKNGTFTIDGLLLGPVDGYARGRYIAAAYAIDENGAITHASDLGFYGAGSYPNIFEVLMGQLGTYETPRRFVVARFDSIALFDLFPRYKLRGYEFHDAHVRSAKGFSTDMVGVSILDHTTHFAPLSYGYAYDDIRGVALAFLERDKRVEMVVRDEAGTFMGILTNSSEEFPMGSGFLPTPETTFVHFTTGQLALDGYRLNYERYRAAAEKGVSDAVSLELMEGSKASLETSLDALEGKDYETAYIMALRSLLYSVRAYGRVISLTTEILNATVFFFSLMIPFSFLAERLFLSWGGYKRILGVALAFMIPMVILYFFHPGFSMASQVFALMMGFLVFILTLPVLFLIFSKAFGQFMALRRAEVTAHIVEVGRLTRLVTSVSVGVENMRKRRLRTALTLFTLFLLAFSMVAAMSMATFNLKALFPAKGIAVPYNGIFIKKKDQFTPFSEQTIAYIQAQLPPESNPILAPRAAYYPMGLDFPALYVESASGKVRLKSLLGVSPYQDDVDPKFSLSLLEGRWFEEEDYLACTVSERTASILQAKVGDKVTILGFRFTLIGIYNSTILNQSTDLDGAISYPLNMFEATSEQRIYTYGDEMAVVPYRFAHDLGARPYGLSIRMENAALITSTAESLANQMPRLTIFAAVDTNVFEYSVMAMAGIASWQLLLIPIAIVAILTSNVMLGAVYERRREITIFSSVGLSPFDVGFMFISESMVHGIVAAVLGYVAGVTSLYLMTKLSPVAGFVPNYSSWLMAIVMGVSVVTTLISSVYPWREASRAVTPSLERRWTLPTKPMGDRWELPLPFVLSEEAAVGALTFLEEFLSTHTSEEAGVFITRNLRYGKVEVEGRPLDCLTGTFRLEPFRANIEHEATILFPPIEDRRGMQLILYRTGGAPKHWQKSSYFFIDELRRQMLLYAGFPASRKQPYIQRGMERIQRIC